MAWPVTGVVADVKPGRFWAAEASHGWVCGQPLVEGGQIGGPARPGLEKAEETCWGRREAATESPSRPLAVLGGVQPEAQCRVLVAWTWGPL